MAGIQQHGQQQHAVFFVALRGEVARQLGVTPHAHAFKPGKIAVTAFKNGGKPGAGHARHVFVGGQRQGQDAYLVVLGDAVKLHALHDVHQRNYRTRSARAPRTPCAVDITFVIFGRLVQKDVRKLGNINAPSRHVCSHKILQLALTYFFQHGLAPRLRKVGGELVGAVAKTLQYARHVVHVRLGIAKNDGGGGVFGLQQAHKRPVLVHGLHLAKEVLHFGYVHFFLREGKHGGLGHKLAGQPEHMGRIRGRKKAGMDALLRQVPLDFLHVGVKPDRKHAISLVKDQLAQIAQIQGAAQQMVKHSAGRAHDNLCAVAQGVHLLFITHAAVNGDGTDAGFGKNYCGLALNLNGELSGGGQHQGLWRLEVGGEVGKHGQKVAARFAAAGAGLHHNVAPCQQVGQCQRLHGHKILPASSAAGRAHGFRQGVKGHPGQGVFGLADGYALQHGVGRGIRTFTHGGIVFCHVFSRRFTRHN